MMVVNFVSSHNVEDIHSLLTASFMHTDSCNSLYNAHSPNEIHNTYSYPIYDRAQISSVVNERCL